MKAIDVHTPCVYDKNTKGDMMSIHKRINIILPEETLDLIDRVTEQKDRSCFIDEAVRHYIEETSRVNLRRRLKEGAMQRAKRDLSIAGEWFTLDEDVCRAGRQ